MEAVRSGRRPWAKLDDLHRENLAQLLAEFGLGGLDEADARASQPRLAPARPLARRGRRADPAEATLHPGHALQRQRRAHGQPGAARRPALGRDPRRRGRAAPTSRCRTAYLRTADYLGLAPAELLMVAAHNGDLVAAARGCGFRTAFVARPTEHGPRRPATARGSTSSTSSPATSSTWPTSSAAELARLR